jgi:DNA polymerase-1
VSEGRYDVITYTHSVNGEPVRIYIPETDADLREFMHWARNKPELALDTETTGLDIYAPGYRMKPGSFITNWADASGKPPIMC